MADTKLFSVVPDKDYLDLFPKGSDEPDCEKVVKFLQMRKEEVSRATNMPAVSIRYDNRIPNELRTRIREWANLFNLVAGHFKGDARKTYLWLTMPNPMLGDLSPKDMIRYGRYRKLLRFVVDSLREN